MSMENDWVTNTDVLFQNFIFQKQPCREDSQPWTAIGPTPTLTPLQVIGKTDKRLLEAYRRKKKPSLTIAA